MAVVVVFSFFLQALLYAICSPQACLQNFETETTRYNIVSHRQELYLSISCHSKTFTVDGERVIKCINGQLPTLLPQCVPSKGRCAPLHPPTYGSKNCSSTFPELGSSCSFKCRGSHYLSGARTRHCSQDLRWTGSVARCFKKPECAEPPPLHQGTVIGCSPERKIKYNDICQFRCNPGFQLAGPSQMTCRLNRRLTDEKGRQSMPKCHPILPANSTTLAPSGNETLGSKPFSVPRISCQLDNGYCSHFCHQEPKTVRCSCKSGYQLSRNGRTCIDVDECADINLNKCEQLCQNTAGSFKCLCREGYTSSDFFGCGDLNECLDEKLNKCNQTCENTIGGYKCSCRAGFVSSDGFRCEGCRMNSYRAIDDIACRDCPANSHTDGYEKTSINDCICNAGFTGNPGQRIPCKDIDECADGQKFGCSHTCINTPGNAHCACPSGYQLEKDQKTCIDIDECSIKNGGCDGTCHNTEGNFTCSCPEGYVASSENKYTCDDVDECSVGNGGCSGQCVNFKGGFHCFCQEGYHLHPDGKTCIPVHCPRVSVPHHSTLRCKNSASSNKTIFRPSEMPEDAEFPVGATCRIKCDKGYEVQDSTPAIFCQNDGKWNASLPRCRNLQCPPLLPPANGDVYPPACKEGSAAVKQKCVFTCQSGYQIKGQEVLTCRNNLTWLKKTPTKCVSETELSISCPDDDISVELLPTEAWAEIRLNPPRSSSGPIRVSPDWVSLDRASIFPAGETEVNFAVTAHNRTADCSISVIVLDKHPPIFSNCPGNLLVTSGIGGTVVNWEEPIAEDNVGVASVSKSLEPNTTLSPGLHFVEYVARDFAGNIGQCIFHINIEASDGCGDLADPENGAANCLEWMFGKICQPTCFANFTRPTELYACDESGTWTPTNFISPCLPECFTDEMWSPDLKKCVKMF